MARGFAESVLQLQAWRNRMKAEPVGAALLRLSIKGRIVHAFVHTRPAHGFKFTWQGRVLCPQLLQLSQQRCFKFGLSSFI